jgi:hypothetical protein
MPLKQVLKTSHQLIHDHSSYNPLICFSSTLLINRMVLQIASIFLLLLIDELIL